MIFIPPPIIPPMIIHSSTPLPVCKCCGQAIRPKDDEGTGCLPSIAFAVIIVSPFLLLAGFGIWAVNRSVDHYPHSFIYFLGSKIADLWDCIKHIF